MGISFIFSSLVTCPRVCRRVFRFVVVTLANNSGFVDLLFGLKHSEIAEVCMLVKRLGVSIDWVLAVIVRKEI